MNSSSSSTPDDRREAERYASSQDASCHPASNCDTTSVKIKDVSRRGVGLISSRRFQPGTLLVLELGENASHAVNILSRVVRSAPHPGGEWLAGCVFLSELSEEDFAAFRSDRKLRANGSRRAEARNAVNRVAICSRAGAGTMGKCIAEVRDISLDGIALLLPVRVEVGSRLRIEITADEFDQAQTELVSVIHSERQPDGRWLLGCKVLPSPQTAQVKVLATPGR